MYKPLLYILLTILPYNLAAQQNLVPNPSFEDTLYCPLFLADFSVANWRSANLGTPDFFHVCQSSNVNVGVPDNALGWQFPRTGDAFVGVVNNAYPGTNVREYVQCELLNSLIVDKEYVVEFFVSRADNSGKATDIVGAFLSDTPVFLNDIGHFLYSPQITNTVAQDLTDNVNWIRVRDTIIANGGEKYLTIGIFKSNPNWIDVSGSLEYDAALFLDDVSVIELSKAISFPNVFTPNDDGVNDVFQVEYSGFLNGELKIYDRWGRLVSVESGLTLNWDGKVDGVNATTGVYFIGLEMEDINGAKTFKRGYVHLLR